MAEKLNLIYQGRNLVNGIITGKEAEDSLFDTLKDDSLDSAEEYPEVVTQELIDGLAAQLFESSNAKKGDKVILVGVKGNIRILESIANLCIENDVDFELDIEDKQNTANMLKGLDDEGIGKLADAKNSLYKDHTTKIEVRSSYTPDDDVKENWTKYSNAVSESAGKFGKDNHHYVITLIPTPEDAKADGMPYDEYMKLFFEACDQPWKEIKIAQAKLKKLFDEGKEVHIEDDRGTNLDFSIEEMTFANSVTLKNVPGSEIFSSPVLESVQGTLVADGKFHFRGFDIENIRLEFTDGKITEAIADKGQEGLNTILDTDDGARFIGEFAMGTNPHLRRQFVNVLLAEKVGGSFHFTPGNAYPYTKYDEDTVNVNNGNTSKIHCDITTMLRGRGGKIFLDGKLIQDDGKWLVDGVEVLEKGWGAMKEDEQPDWWKEGYPNGYEEAA